MSERVWMLSAASEQGRSASSTHVPRETHMMPICVMRGSAWRQAARTATRDTSSAGERVCAQLWLLPAPRRAMERLAHLTDGESASAKYATCSPGPLATSSTRAPSWTWCFNCCSIGVRFRPKAGEAGRRRCIGGSRSGADRPGRHDGDGEDDGRRVVAAAARRSEQARMLVTRRRGGAHERRTHTQALQATWRPWRIPQGLGLGPGASAIHSSRGGSARPNLWRGKP